MREELQRIFDEYGSAQRESFAGHELARFIRGPLAAEFQRAVVADSGELIWKGSAGMSNWATRPGRGAKP